MVGIAKGNIPKIGNLLPLVRKMILLITWVAVSGDPQSVPLIWFVIGLIFCLSGDIFLMLPPEQQLGEFTRSPGQCRGAVVL
jgi:hypothetical protein